MRLCRVRSRGMLYATLFIFAVWVTSMVTINLSTGTQTYQNRVVSAARALYSDGSNDHGAFTAKRITPKTELSAQLIEIARSLHRAQLHVRGTKTSDELHHANLILDDVLKALGINRGKLLRRNILTPKSVCPEEYMGSTYGYPFFYKGFEKTKCSHAKPIAELVSVVTYINENDKDKARQRAEKFLNAVTNISNLATIIASYPDFTPKGKYPGNIKYIGVQKKRSEGYIWNGLVAEVKTPYVLVARDIDFLTEDMRVERLVRAVESLQVTVAAGALRYPDGHWKKGCYQSVHKNFTLRYLEGYDESIHECIFCDYTDAPFLTSVETIRTVPFVEVDMEIGIFEDWFLRLNHIGKETVVCPDAMFHLRQRESGKSWKNFMTHLDLYKLIPTSGETVISDCSKMGTVSNTRGLSPCKLKGNADAVNTIMNACDENKLICELQEGTSLGAVKFEKVLPWERDADIAFLSGNYTAFQKLGSYFTDKGFKFIDNKALWCCADNRTAGGKFNLGYKSWSIEMYGQHKMDSEMLLDVGIKPTRVLLDGNWVMAPRNPGLFVRNRYGHEIYQHAVHWMTTRSKSGWEPYNTNTFPICDSPGSHDCLDRFNADGSLPFSDDPLP